MFAATKAFFAKAVTTLTPSWVLDFSTGEPWSNGTDYNYTSTRTAGTYVDSSGYIATSVANLLLQSEDFGTTWANANTTETTNTVVSPDGTTTADTLTESAGFGLIRWITQNANIVTGTTYTLTVYAKKDTATVIQMTPASAVGGANEWANYDLDNGVVGSVGTSVTGNDATITSVGNGWYRCKLTWVSTATSASAGMFIILTNNNASAARTPGYSVAAGNEHSLYLWGAQLVQGSEALTYSKTTTAANGIPRLTHNSSGTRLGLLVEESRTNLCPTSETTAGVASNTAVTTNNTGPAPDNTNTAELMSEVVANGTHHCGTKNTTANVDLDSLYVYSVFLKRPASNATQYAVVTFLYATSDRRFTQVFDLSAGSTSGCATRSSGTPVDTTSGIEAYANGWYRCWVSHRSRNTNETFGQGIVQFSDSANPGTWIVNTYPSYNVTSAKDMLVWGHQIEKGANPSTYIANTGSGSTTRASDNAYILDSKITSWQDPGALVIHFYPPGQAGTLISSDDGANTQLGIQASSTTAVRAFWSSGSTATGTLTNNVQRAVHYWNGTSSKFCLNGGTVESGTNNVTTFSNLDFLTLGSEATDSSGVPGTYSQYANCIVRRVEWYGQTMTDAQLQSITEQPTYSITYLVVAGGGGGNRSGGGAGGYREGTLTATAGTNMVVTVGGGGANNVNGSDSVFSTITSTGGGRGVGNIAGGSGGSGGGGGSSGSGTNLGGAGTSGQGNAGGSNGGFILSPFPTGGGGGAGAAGGNATGNSDSGNGGNGTASTISGVSVTRAGGGAGGYTGATGTATVGGTGGGGNIEVAGTVNSGGGGGGGYGGTNGKAGGSGVVILRIPAANYSGITTGSPTVTDDGSFKVLVYNSSGSYIA